MLNSVYLLESWICLTEANKGLEDLWDPVSVSLACPTRGDAPSLTPDKGRSMFLHNIQTDPGVGHLQLEVSK